MVETVFAFMALPCVALAPREAHRTGGDLARDGRIDAAPEALPPGGASV
jgi:hypothetical protein